MPVRPSVRLTTLPAFRSHEERFRLAALAGFEGVELEAGSGCAAEIREAAGRTGIVVHSVHTLANWTQPLSSPDPVVRAAGIRATVEALEEAHFLGADTVQLVPGRVQADTSYREAHDRSREVIRGDILPVAERLGIVLGVENVWNGFLLDPVEFVRYTDSFGSSFVRPYLDVGNVIFGRPEDWIEIAGARIVKLHLKDFRFEERKGRFRYEKIGDGDIDWRKVREALDRIGFSGWGTFAQAEQLQGPVALRLHHRVANPPSLLRAVPGARALLGAADTFLARRLLDDVMARHRRYIACNP
jgi:L-ribulose-5-phosphate 3-epimerase